MKVRLKYEETRINKEGNLYLYKFDEEIILSDEIGFDKNTYQGWYVDVDDLNKDGVYTRRWYYDKSWREVKDMKDVDITKCRKIIQSSWVF